MEHLSVVLVLATFLTSIVSGFLSMAGGIMLLAVMSEFFVPAVLIPIHGVIQLASNSSRVLLLFKHIDKKIWLHFAIGAPIGASIGAYGIGDLPESTFRLVIAAFIIIMTWLPKFKKAPKFPGKFGFLGTAATGASLYIGATGPFIAPFFIRENLRKEGIVATKAACQTCVHVFKIIAYGILGFSFAEYFNMLAVLVLVSFLGNFIGKQLLGRISQVIFLKIFKVVLTILGLRMFYQAAISL